MSQPSFHQDGQGLERNTYASMSYLFDSIFDRLQNFAYTINANEQRPHFRLTWTKLGEENQSQGNNARPSTLLARVSTRDWLLIIKGALAEIVAYIVPAEQLIAFTPSQYKHPPYLRIAINQSGNGTDWHIQGEAVGQEHIPIIARDLIETLLRYVGNQPPQSPVFSLAALNNPDNPAAKPELSQAPQQVRAPSQGNSRESATVVMDVPHKVAQENSPPPRPVPANESFETKTQVDFDGWQRVTHHPVSTLPASHTVSPLPAIPATQEQAVSLPDALQLMLAALDLELDAVARAGAEAFNQKDLDRAHAILAFTNRLIEFRQVSQRLLDDYHGND